MKRFTHMPRLRILASAALALLAAAPCSQSVVVALDNTTAYTQAPTAAGEDFGFGNFTHVFNTFAGIPSSGVYLGNGWVLTAYHNLTDGGSGFQFGGISIQGVSYTADPATATRLHNPVIQNFSALADLAMFRLTVVPSGVPSLTLSGATPSFGTSVRMMGNGQDRALSETHWNSSWTEEVPPFAETGYKLVGTQTVRWGTNTMGSGNLNIGDSYGDFVGFLTTFNASAGDAQATGGDSGGGVFRKNGNNWELAGIMLGADQPTGGQPAGTILYGDRTFAASIGTYKNEIESIRAMPEPSTAIFSLTGLAITLQRRRRGAAK